MPAATYQATETLFKNGNTLVHRGIRKGDQQSVIIRALNDVLHSESQQSRLAFSGEILKKFDHPNIVKVLDFVEDNAGPKLIMEDIGAIDLLQFATTFDKKQLPVETFLNIATALADALSVIHHGQVIHKDLHPGNIVVNPATLQVQIIDFGLASLLSREQPALAPPENLEGVLAYLSPEQTGRMNRALDYRTDFYTLGVTFYQLLTGRLPFSAKDAIGWVHAHIAKAQVPVHELRPEVPPILSNIIDKLMEKTAENRYQSALGLKHDLVVCLRAVIESQTVPAFSLGLNDISDRFQIPQVLYGREREIEQLMDSFYLAAKGQPQLLAVGGYSGIGKSALIHEVHKPIAAHHGLFISGKFDQFQKNIPYSALKQAFKGWIQHALMLPDAALDALRSELSAALGSTARVMVDFMLEFQLFLGDLPPLPPLGAQESQNRFHLTMQRFVQQVTQYRPLVIFIDDIQWADRGTLDLLPLLLSRGDIKSAGNSRLLLLVAYRDNEMDKTHPSMIALEKIQQADLTSKSLILRPLSVSQINRLLVDALRQTKKTVQPLAERVHKKTAGNPFFIIEFLKTLYNHKLLNFDLKTTRWTWDLAAIDNQNITDNVVDLMLGKMQMLPAETQTLLQQAACIGSQFDLQNLAIISEQSITATVRALWPALKEGLLLQEGGDWLLGIVETCDKQDHLFASNEISTRLSSVVPQCRFLHDRMLQAAYESQSDEARQQAHLRIGRLLLKHTLPEQLDSQLFSIIEQLNLGRALIDDPEERLQLARLNLQAAQKAKAANVWVVAFQLVQIGNSLLIEQNWQSDYSLCFQINLLEIESAFLTVNPTWGSELAETTLLRANTSLEKAQICAILSNQPFIESVEFTIEKGIAGLRYCGIEIPHPSELTDELLIKEQNLLSESLLQRELERIMAGKVESKPSKEMTLAFRLFAQLSGSIQISGDSRFLSFVAYKGVNIALNEEPSEHSIIIYGMYALILSKQGKHVFSDQIFRIVLSLLDSYPQCADKAYIYMMLGTFGWHFSHPLQQAIDFQLKAHELGYELGDISRGVFAGYSNAIINYYAQGLPLNKLADKLAHLEAIKDKFGINISGGSLHGRLVAMLTLQKEGNQFLESDFDDDDWQIIKSSVLKAFVKSLQLQWFFWSDQLDQALNMVQLSRDTSVLLNGFITLTDHHLITGLLACRLPANNENTSVVENGLNKLSELAGLCPENFEHKYLLLQAELGRYQNQPLEHLMPLYEEAISSAANNGFLQYAALANELYASFWLEKKHPRIAQTYLMDALYFYQRWGCTVKVKNLRRRYQELLSPASSDNSARRITSSVSADSLGQSSHSMSDSLSSSLSDNSLASSQQGLDLSSVMKSAQVISSELEVNSLLAKVMQVIVESAGAQIGAFVLNQPSGASIEAFVDIQTAEQVFLESRPLADAKDLPVSMISYVLRTDTDLILQEGSTGSADQPFVDDAYLKQAQPQSVLCAPIDYRDKQIGALYLENATSSKAFSEARFDVIKLLLAQAAISYENARLFDEVQSLNEGLEKKVEERTAELKQANEEMESFTHMVSHDLRAPVRSIRRFSEAIVDELGDDHQDIALLVERLQLNTQKMNDLIEGLLALSRAGRQQLNVEEVDLTKIALDVVEGLRRDQPLKRVEFRCVDQATVMGDHRMLSSVMENLLNNAWKYSSKTESPVVEFGYEEQEFKGTLQRVFFVKDNGAGFDMADIDRLFGTFQRLHSEKQFKGTGVGLSTVKKVINRHGGEIWAEAEVNKGAKFFFTIGEPR